MNEIMAVLSPILGDELAAAGRKIWHGAKHNRLTAVCKSDRKSSGGWMWKFKCDCGSEVVAKPHEVTRGRRKSCGCYNREKRNKHGMSRTIVYKRWLSMKDRCFNENNARYPRYGGRGISVDARWMSFEAFFEDMGDCPPGTSLERLNNEKGYSKENCVWASAKEQSRNRSTNVFVEHDGKTLCIADWADVIGVHRASLSSKAKYMGGDHKKAVAALLNRGDVA